MAGSSVYAAGFGGENTVDIIRFGSVSGNENIFPMGRFSTVPPEAADKTGFPGRDYSIKGKECRYSFYTDAKKLLYDLEGSFFGDSAPHLVSIEHTFGLEWVPDFIKKIKSVCPGTKVIVGPIDMHFISRRYPSFDYHKSDGASLPWVGRDYVDSILNSVHSTFVSERYFSDLLRSGCDALIESVSPTIPFGLLPWKKPIIGYLLSNRSPKLYLIIAPPGYGKSMLMGELRYLGFRELKKVTTRPYRSESEMHQAELVSVSDSRFKKMGPCLVGVRNRGDHYYGLMRSDIERIVSGGSDFIADIGNFRSALELKAEYPEIVRLVGFDMGLDFAGFGLEERVRKLSEPRKCFTSIKEEMRYLVHAGQVRMDTKRRMTMIIAEAISYCRGLGCCDIRLNRADSRSNASVILDYASSDVIRPSLEVGSRSWGW